MRDAVAETWGSTFSMYRWKRSEEDPNLFILSGRISACEERTIYLAGCKDAWLAEVYVDYNPQEDTVGVYLKDRPIQAKF